MNEKISNYINGLVESPNSKLYSKKVKDKPARKPRNEIVEISQQDVPAIKTPSPNLKTRSPDGGVETTMTSPMILPEPTNLSTDFQGEVVLNH